LFLPDIQTIKNGAVKTFEKLSLSPAISEQLRVKGFDENANFTIFQQNSEQLKREIIN
jgi:hypothetical protein